MATDTALSVSLDMLEDEQTVRVDITFADTDAAARFSRWFVAQMDAGRISFGESAALPNGEVAQ